MKITLVGAAGVRTPLLVHGLAGLDASAHLDELALWDTDPERLKAMQRVAEAMAVQRGLRARLKAYSDPGRALEGADYIITSIRVGGIDARVKDETIALAMDWSARKLSVQEGSLAPSGILGRCWNTRK